MPNRSQKNHLLTIIILVLAQLIFLFVVKYLNQDLPLKYFSIAKTGNIFNLLIYAGIICGIIIGIRKNKSGITNKTITTISVD